MSHLVLTPARKAAVAAAHEQVEWKQRLPISWDDEAALKRLFSSLPKSRGEPLLVVNQRLLLLISCGVVVRCQPEGLGRQVEVLELCNCRVTL